MRKPYEDLILSLPDVILSGGIPQACEAVGQLPAIQACYVVGCIVEHLVIDKRQGDAVRFLQALDRRAALIPSSGQEPTP